MDNFRDSYFKIDWDLSQKRLKGTFWGKQYDTGRGFTVTVINGGQVVTATNEVLRLKWEKPDNTTGYVNATIVNGKFIVENIDQMFTVQGAVRADFELSVAGESLASITFYVSVEKAVAVGAIESSSEFTALQTALSDVDVVKSQLAENAMELEGVDRVLVQSDFASKNLKLNGTFIINVAINLADIKIEGAGVVKQLASIYIGDNVTIDNVTFDLENAYGESVFLQGKNISIIGNVFKNAYSSTFSRFIYIKDNCENVHIARNTFRNISALANGIIGDSNGSVRAIQSQNAKKVVIEDNIFEGIQTEEDSDYIAILASSSKVIGTKTYFEHGDIKIRNNHFKNPLKSTIKVQCSGVEITGNFIESDGVVFTRNIFRIYNSADVKICDNYTDKNMVYENIIQSDTVLNGQFDRNRIYTNKASGFVGTLFFITDTSSDSLSVKENIIIGDSLDTLVLTKFVGTKDVNYAKNIFDSHTIDFSNASKINVSNNTFLKYAFVFIEISAGTVNSEIRVERNVVKETARLINVRSEGNTNIYLTDNTVLIESAGFVAFSFFIAGQDKTQFKVIDRKTKYLSYGVTADRPAIGKYVGYPYFDTTINKTVTWNGSVWKDATGATV